MFFYEHLEQFFPLYQIHKKLFSARTFFDIFYQAFGQNPNMQFCRAKLTLSFEILLNSLRLTPSKKINQIRRTEKYDHSFQNFIKEHFMFLSYVLKIDQTRLKF